jgi:hypothetical protein
VLYIMQPPESHTLWSAATSQIATSARVYIHTNKKKHTHSHKHTHTQRRLLFELALFPSSLRMLTPPDDQHSTGRRDHVYSHFRITIAIHTSGVKDRLRYTFPAIITEMDTTIKLRSKLCNTEKNVCIKVMVHKLASVSRVHVSIIHFTWN